MYGWVVGRVRTEWMACMGASWAPWSAADNQWMNPPPPMAPTPAYPLCIPTKAGVGGAAGPSH